MNVMTRTRTTLVSHERIFSVECSSTSSADPLRGGADRSCRVGKENRVAPSTTVDITF